MAGTDRSTLSYSEESIMHYDDAMVRAAIAAIMFCGMLAAHYVGDHWVQTCGQAIKKVWDGPDGRMCAAWHCAKHAATWSVTQLVFLTVTVWWLDLPVRPGWLAGGVAFNALTHFVIDLRVPLLWVAQRVNGRGDYIEAVQVVRPSSGAASTGPGTGLFHLDQSAHLACAFVAALIVAGPA